MTSKKSIEKIKVTKNVDYFEMLLEKEKDTSGNIFLDDKDLRKIDSAYDKAHDIRKFEIGLYWQRTSYIWGFISVLIAGFGYCFVSYFGKDVSETNKTIYSTLMLITSLIGLSFTRSWRMMLQSSKFWQENWELTIAVLEPYITGNLHKIHFHRYKDPYARSSIHKIMLSLMSRFYALWFILLIASMLIFLNTGLNLVDDKDALGLYIVKLVIYLVALIYPLYELIVFTNHFKNEGGFQFRKNFLAWIKARKERKQHELNRLNSKRERKLSPDDICIVYDDISVEKEKII